MLGGEAHGLTQWGFSYNHMLIRNYWPSWSAESRHAGARGTRNSPTVTCVDCLCHVSLCSNCYHLHVTEARTKDQRSSERKINLTKVTQRGIGRPGI